MISGSSVKNNNNKLRKVKKSKELEEHFGVLFIMVWSVDTAVSFDVNTSIGKKLVLAKVDFVIK